VKLVNDSFFNEFTLQLPKPAIAVVEELAKRRILGGVPVARLVKDKAAENLLLVAATELTTEAEMDALEAGLKEVLK
jgi:glycine dehydrogenase subunit 1